MADQIIGCARPVEVPASTGERIQGVVVGVLVGLAESGAPLVAFPGNPVPSAVEARSTVAVTGDDLGREVALLFEQGDPRLPVLVGPMQRAAPGPALALTAPPQVQVDGERVVLSAGREIVLRCGEASITLTRAGKIVIRGAYVLSRSSGVNRIKGAAIQLN